MKDIPLPQIDQMRAYFENKKFSIEQITVAGKLFKYYVLPKLLNPNLADFAFRATHTDETNNVTGIFGVCETVPQALRPYWAMHEIIEFTQIGIDKKGRCAEAERLVLEEIPAELKKEFIDRRINFFTLLPDYFKKEIAKGKDDYTVEDIQEAEESLRFLQSIK